MFLHRYPNVTQKLIIRRQDKVLVFSYENGAYGFPGGKLEWKEDMLEGLKRELREEMGYELVEMPRLFNVHSHMERFKHAIKITYILEVASQPQAESLASHRKVVWLNKEELSNAFDQPEFVEKIFAWKDPGTTPSYKFAM